MTKLNEPIEFSQDLKMNELEWDSDSVEMLLPLAYPTVGMLPASEAKRKVISSVLDGSLTSGPQYLKHHPAQEPYLDFVRDAFSAIAESFTSPPERTGVYVWWLRFERLLVSLNEDKGKKLKVIVKDFLKIEENRNNLHFYREYALFEREIGRLDSCVKILETAIGMQSDFLSTLSSHWEKGALCSVFRTLLETLLSQGDRRGQILDAVARMVSGPDENRLEQAEEFLETSVQDFLEQSLTDAEEESYFIPSFEGDLITCYAYYLYAKNSELKEAIGVLEECIEHSKGNKYLQVIISPVPRQIYLAK